MIKVAYYSFFPGGGIGRYNMQLLPVLARQAELKVQLICSPEFEWQDLAGVGVHPILMPLSHRVPLVRRTRFLTAQFVNPRRAVRFASAHGVQILHLSNLNHLTLPFWHGLLKLSGLRMAITVHDVLREKPILHRGWETRQLRRAYQFADALFVHSEYQRNVLAGFSGVPEDRIHVVPHGPYPYPPASVAREEMRSRLGVPSHVRLALFFGQVRDDKNLAAFLHAMAFLPENVHLLVAGQAGGRHAGPENYASICRQLGIADRVHFQFGHVAESEVSDLFRAADLAVLPYRSSFTSQSGVLNIAAWCKCPVLVSNAPVLRETVANSGIGVACSGDDPSALAAGMQLLLSQIESGRRFPFDEYLETYSWERNAEVTAQAYRTA